MFCVSYGRKSKNRIVLSSNISLGYITVESNWLGLSNTPLQLCIGLRPIKNEGPEYNTKLSDADPPVMEL